MPRPIRASFRLSALRHNLGVARRRAPAAKVWAVIKANAYGHGLLRVAQTLSDADGYALLDLNDAVRLREAGCAKPILLLEGMFQSTDIELLDRYRLAPALHGYAQIAMLEQASLAAPVPVWLKVDTGMNRLGFEGAEVRAAYARMRASANVGRISLMTHFADADGAGGVAAQMARFAEWTAGIDAEISLANSAAILRYPEAQADWVRPGIMLYGCSPFADTSAQALDLQPVMTLESEIIAVRDLQVGERVGYGGTYTAQGPMRIGVVACGYADGYPRQAPGRNDSNTPVLVAGVRTHTVGRVSMDMLCVDLSAVSAAGIGSPVVLWGERLSADEVAASAGTISYELLCALAARVPQTEIE